jgi:hypothetical protein
MGVLCVCAGAAGAHVDEPVLAGGGQLPAVGRVRQRVRGGGGGAQRVARGARKGLPQGTPAATAAAAASSAAASAAVRRGGSRRHRAAARRCCCCCGACGCARGDGGGLCCGCARTRRSHLLVQLLDFVQPRRFAGFVLHEALHHVQVGHLQARQARLRLLLALWHAAQVRVELSHERQTEQPTHDG